MRRWRGPVRYERALTWDTDARAMWQANYPHLTAERPGLFGSCTGRATAQLTRLLLIRALLDCSEAITTITSDHLQAALALWRYCEDSARSIFGDKLGNRVAAAVLDMLKSRKLHGLTRAEIYDRSACNASKAEIDAALQLLSTLKVAFGEKEGTGEPGRPPER